MMIRKAQMQDIPGILSLLKQVGQVHHNIRPDIFPAGTLKYNDSQLATLLQDETRPVFVADVDGVVAGYCFCVHQQVVASSCAIGRQELYIDDLCVDENHRRLGLARALYNHTLEYAKETGCNFITLHVWNGNDSAIRFYEQMGMTERYLMMEIPLEETEC